MTDYKNLFVMSKKTHIHKSKVIKEFALSFFRKLLAKNKKSVSAFVGSTPSQFMLNDKIDEILKDQPKLEYKEAKKLAYNSLHSSETPIPKYYFPDKGSERYSSSITKKDKNKYDCIFWDDLPFNPPKPLLKLLEEKEQFKQAKNTNVLDEINKDALIKYNKENYIYESRVTEFLSDLELLSKSGFMLFYERLYKDQEKNLFENKIFENLLNNHGFYINAVFEVDPSKSKVYFYDSILIISRNNNEEKLVAELKFLADFDIELLTSSDIKKSEIVSYFDAVVDKNVVQKLEKGDFTLRSPKETSTSWGLLVDGDRSNAVISFDKFNLNISEACEAISNWASTKYVKPGENYILIKGISSITKNKGESSLLVKSKLLGYLRQDWRILAYHAATKELGGQDAIIAYVSQGNVIPAINRFFAGATIDNDEKELKEGFFISNKDFFSLRLLRIKDQIEKNIFFFYQGYKEVKLRDLTTINDEENLDLITEKIFKERVIQNNIGKCVAILSKSIASNNKELVALNIDSHTVFSESRSREDILFYFEDNTIGEYVSFFLNSELGRQIFEYDTKNFRKNAEILVEDILDLRIFIPENETIADTVSANNKIHSLQQAVNEFSESFSLNPKSAINGRLDKLDDMLSVAGKLNKQDRVHAIIRGSEKGDAEFKASWKFPMKKVSDHSDNGDMTEDSIRVESMVIKVINSFINTNGGDLLIGVDDDTQNIIGLEGEIKHYYKKFTSIKKQVDEYDREFGIALRNCFDVKFIGKNNNISSEMVEMEDGKFVYHVSCYPSKEPCLIQKVAKGKYKKILPALKDHDFYIRKKSESIALEGQARMDYILSRRDTWPPDAEDSQELAQ